MNLGVTLKCYTRFVHFEVLKSRISFVETTLVFLFTVNDVKVGYVLQ